MCAKSLRWAWLFESPWSVACQASICSWDSPGKNTGVSCLFPSAGNLWDSGIELASHYVSFIRRWVFYCWATWEPPNLPWLPICLLNKVCDPWSTILVSTWSGTSLRIVPHWPSVHSLYLIAQLPSSKLILCFSTSRLCKKKKKKACIWKILSTPTLPIRLLKLFHETSPSRTERSLFLFLCFYSTFFSLSYSMLYYSHLGEHLHKLRVSF